MQKLKIKKINKEKKKKKIYLSFVLKIISLNNKKSYTISSSSNPTCDKFSSKCLFLNETIFL